MWPVSPGEDCVVFLPVSQIEGGVVSVFVTPAKKVWSLYLSVLVKEFGFRACQSSKRGVISVSVSPVKGVWSFCQSVPVK